MATGTEVRKGMAALGGGILYYESAGEGPDLVLVHAGIADRRMWDEQFPDFARNFRVTRYDLRGFGNSKPPSEPFSHRQDLFRLLKFLDIKQAHLVGCSAGGAVVLDFALEHPEMASSLVLVSSALGGYSFAGEIPKPLQELFGAIKAGDFKKGADLAVRIWVDGPRRKPRQVKGWIRTRMREWSLHALPNFFVQQELLTPPASERLRTVQAPTLVLAGDQDDDGILALAEMLVEQIPDAQKVIVSNAAHMLNLEKPQEFNRLVTAFLEQYGGVQTRDKFG